MTDYTIPRANAPIAGTEPPSPPWYNFLRYLDTRTASAAGDVQAEITVIAEKLGSPDGTVDNIPPLGNVTSVQGKQSIASSGIGVVQLRLVNDAEMVDAVSFYGTDSAGVKGWNLLYDAFADTDNIFKINTDGIVSFDLTDLADSGAGALLATTFDAKGRKTGTKSATITGTAGRITVVNGDAVAGLPTIDLATLSDGGGGALLRIVRDAWGRLSGTSAATTSDLTEGSNLYYTTTRVLATLLAGLSTATSAAITAADSVLSAFGKLQAQITALTASLTGYVPTTRTISTTAPLTGGGDLSANRTLALANTAVTPASYGDATHVATFTVDAQGRLTAAGSVAITAGAVSSVFGRTGAVVSATNDYTFAQIGSTPTTLVGYGITDAQPIDATLTALAAANWAANALPIGSGADTVAQVSFAANTFPARASTGNLVAKTITDFGLSLVDDADASAAGATLGLGTAALVNTGNSGAGVVPLLSTNAGQTIIALSGVTGRVSLSLTTAEADGAGKPVFNISGLGGPSTSGSSEQRVAIFGANTDGTTANKRGGSFGISLKQDNSDTLISRFNIGYLGHMTPGVDNAQTNGSAAFRWSVVYAGTGTINTSDAREKTEVSPLTSDELAAAADLARAPGTYQWLAAVQAKGADARKHAGLTVQRAIEIMQSHGLDPMSYGFICYDEWAETPEVTDPETGEVTQPFLAAGDRYSFRHDELLLFIARGFAARLDALEAA